MDNYARSDGVATIGSKTTTTITATTETESGSIINYRYFKTVPGILKFIQILFGIICITTATPVVLDGTYFFLIVCYVAAIFTAIWSIIILFRIESKVAVNPSWPVLELCYSGAAFVFYAMAATVQFSIYSLYYGSSFYNAKPRSTAAAVFALFNCIAYAVDTFYAFGRWRSPMTINRNQLPHGY